MSHPIGSVRASMLGKLGSNARWSKLGPVERAAAIKPARDALAAKYLARARAMPGSDQLNDKQLADRAHKLQLTNLAALRIKVWDARRARRDAKVRDGLTPDEVGDRVTIVTPSPRSSSPALPRRWRSGSPNLPGPEPARQSAMLEEHD